jgi:cation-transporting ATPase 13A2
MLLACLGFVGFIYSVVVLLHLKVAHGTVAVRAFDLTTTVCWIYLAFAHLLHLYGQIVPPALPAALTVGIIYAVTRLKKARISCISPPRVNVSI